MVRGVYRDAAGCRGEGAAGGQTPASRPWETRARLREGTQGWGRGAFEEDLGRWPKQR